MLLGKKMVVRWGGGMRCFGHVERRLRESSRGVREVGEEKTKSKEDHAMFFIY